MIKSEWIVSNMTARNALVVAQADVYAGAECMVQSTGSVFRAVRSGSGATMWAGVVTASGEWTPVFTGHTNIKTSPAMVIYSATYTRIGDVVEAKAYVGGTLDTTNNSRDFDMTVPVNPGADFAAEAATCASNIVVDGVFDPLWQIAQPTAARLVNVNFGSTAADGTAFYGPVSISYQVVEA
jgi:hypothetical protein